MSETSTQDTAPVQPTNVDEKIPYEILSRPSKCIKVHHKTIMIDSTTYQLVLIRMSRTFLLAINNLNTCTDSIPGIPQRVMAATVGSCDDNTVGLSEDQLIRCFMESNSNLRGLSLAIGDICTCLIESDNSLASSSLATRLSKRLNLSRPVYVANNLQVSQDIIELSQYMSKFYMKVFQFVSSHYNANIDNLSPLTVGDQDCLDESHNGPSTGQV